MTKANCPTGCGKCFINDACARAHADAAHPGWNELKDVKRKGWATPHGFVDFTEPVTYEEACARAEAVMKTVWGKRKGQGNGN